jgi:hypothetical protein
LQHNRSVQTYRLDFKLAKSAQGDAAEAAPERIDELSVDVRKPSKNLPPDGKPQQRIQEHVLQARSHAAHAPLHKIPLFIMWCIILYIMRNTLQESKKVTDSVVVLPTGLVPIFSHVISNLGQMRYFGMVERLQVALGLNCLKSRKEALADAKGFTYVYLRVIFFMSPFPRESWKAELERWKTGRVDNGGAENV